MAVFRCKMCGGDLEIAQGQAVCTCEFCGTEQTLPRLDSDRKANLYDRANHFRRNNDYDKAMGIYEQILNEDNTDAEAYWSLVLCRYGIEYVEDPSTHKRIPTINRAQYTSIYADENYKSAIEHASAAQKIVYEQEAKTIDEIQKGILSISEKEEPFDVFICYKETDNTGRRTPDSVLANDLYHQLTQEDFKVFFARITLEDKLGLEYEPYIFAALNSAKVMVVLGTKPEYFKAVWVKNEWSRYLALIQGGARKMLIPAYKDMDPYDLPEEFSHLQAQDMSKLGFMQDLIRGIKKITGENAPQSAAKETVLQQGRSFVDLNILLKRGNMALEDGEWKKADDFFEEALNQDAECAEAYIGKLLAKYQKSDIASLTSYYIDKYKLAERETLVAGQEETERIEASVSKNAVKDCLSDSEIRKLYDFDRTYTSEFNSRMYQKRKQMSELSEEKLLGRALQYAKGDRKRTLDSMLAEIETTLDQRIAKAGKEHNVSIDSVLSSYKDHLANADIRAEELSNEANQRQEQSYQDSISQMNSAKTIQDFELARDRLKGMNGYRDTMALADICQKKADEIKESERLEEEKRKKRRFIEGWIMVAIAVATFVLWYTYLSMKPGLEYRKALSLFDQGKYEEVIDLLKNTPYENSMDLCKQAQKIVNEKTYRENQKTEMMDAQVGDFISFGHDRWKVLDRDDEKLLIFSNKIITKKAYEDDLAPVTWAQCDLRKWLNGDYILESFDDYEQAMIVENTTMTEDNAYSGAEGGDDTQDKVFILSSDEAYQYLKSSRISSEIWWLRDPGINNKNACYVDEHGYHNAKGFLVDSSHGVCPAMWVSIPSN